MNRDALSLENQQFDVAVIGGGINGAAAARETAMRGFSTVLIESADFGSATSAGCFKMIHGGLRYLQHGDFGRLYESMSEQRILRRIAPHLVHPLPVLVPTYRRLMQRKSVLRGAVCTYELLAAARNRGVEDSHRLPRHSALSRDECLSRAPGLPAEGLTGGVIFYDCQTSNCDRLTLSVVRSAAAAGARVQNYCELIECGTERGGSEAVRINRLTVRNARSGERWTFGARFIINATGPWNEAFGRFLGAPSKRPLRFSKGIQVVVPQIFQSCAVALESPYRDPSALLSRGARSYFVQPWRGYSIVGTSDELFEGDPSTFSISSEEIERFVDEVRAAYRSDALIPEQVRYAFGGLRPLDSDASAGAGGDAKVSRCDELWDHASQPLPGGIRVENLLTMQGVKYTTFRSFAERAGDIAARRLGGGGLTSSSDTPLAGCPEHGFQQLQASLAAIVQDKERVDYLCRNYGSLAFEIREIEEQEPDSARRLRQCSSAVYASDILYAVRREAALTLSDIVLRRTALGTIGSPGRAALEDAAELAGAELHWSAGERERQLEELERHFRQRQGPEPDKVQAGAA